MVLSIVSPVYRAENIVETLVEELHRHVSRFTDSYEIILVEDCGPDRSWDRIKEICTHDDKVRGVKLSRNFGQHNAIAAGLDVAKGEWIIVMDCDMQDRPDQLHKLYAKAMEGYDMVLARRYEKQYSYLKKLSATLFYRVFSFLTDTKQDPSINAFGIYHRKVILAVKEMGDYVRFLPILAQWVGFNRTAIDVEHASRHSGDSSYSLKRLMRLAFSVILSFSEKPLWIGLQFGVLVSIVSFLAGCITAFNYFRGAIDVPGYTSIVISIGFLSGIIICFIGLTGLYIGKIFEKVRNRPNFLVHHTLNIEESNTSPSSVRIEREGVDVFR
jgi:glycosyltransferase involved in cell wall biosynthesis